MNSVDRASRDILIALVIEANRQTSSIPDLNELRSRYNIKISDILLHSSIERWDAQGLLIVARSYDGTGACIKPGKYGSALSELLQLLNATTFEVNWKKEEILTDAEKIVDFPSPSGWKIFQFDRSDLPNFSVPSISSSSWTGLPSDFDLTEERREKLVALLRDSEEALDAIGAGNAEKAMARAYIVAAKVLAETPDPPADLIWELINRASQISGVASLFVSLISLFTVAVQ